VSDGRSDEAERATPDAAPALLRVEHGDPTDEELAALIAVLASRTAVEPTPPGPRRSEWASPARAVRRTHRHGPGGWRAAAFPR
jgi:hypothetical protein